MKCEVEAHESRKMKYLEAAVEQEDQRMKDAEVVEQPQSVQTQDTTMTSSCSSQAGDDVPIAMGATVRDSASKGKRGGESEDEEDQARPATFRTLPPADTGPALALHEPELLHSYDVCVPPRVAHRPRERKLVGGWSLDEHFVDEQDMEPFERQGRAEGDEHGPKTSPKVACGESSAGDAQNGCRGHQDHHIAETSRWLFHA